LFSVRKVGAIAAEGRDPSIAVDRCRQLRHWRMMSHRDPVPPGAVAVPGGSP
jgi:hypothetical protein